MKFYQLLINILAFFDAYGYHLEGIAKGNNQRGVSNMPEEKGQLSVAVARLYYEAELSQQEIANQLQISRPTVSRLLAYAKEKGYVQINISDPFTDIEGVRTALRERYQLKDVQLVFAPTTSEEKLYDTLGEFAARYIESITKDDDVIGVSWGKTIHAIAKHLTPQEYKNIQVVQLKGGISQSKVDTYANETLNIFAKTFNTVPQALPLPVVFDNEVTKHVVEQDRHIQAISNLGKRANTAIFTVGTVRPEALLFQLGYLTADEIELLKKKAVGDICSRFYDENGEVCAPTIDNRTMGIELADLQDKENAILVAGGVRKIQAIDAALKGKYGNILLLDYETAKGLLAYPS